MPGEFEREIRFHCGVQFRRTAEVNVPAAIIELPPPDELCKFCHTFAIESPEDVKIENVIRFERRVGFEFSQPVTVVVLKRSQ